MRRRRSPPFGWRASKRVRRFEGVARRFQLVGEVDGVAVYDDYAHNPAKVAAALATARERAQGRVLALFQPHLYSRTRHLRGELAAALRAANVVGVTEIYAARERPVEGVTGKLVVDDLARSGCDVEVGWMPRLDDGARFVARRARPGDVVVTLGAGDVDRAGPLILGTLERG
jgi:UDP-N-acetylmuramate--alanine ligase